MSSPVANTRRPDGFRERGASVTRLEAFVDAAFAFAVTLLVISLDGMPTNVSELTDALKQIPAFGACFSLIAMFWFAHHTWSRRYGLDNLASVRLSLFFVFLVLVWVFPLRVLVSAAFGWLSYVALPQEWRIPFNFEINGLADLRMMYLVYGMAWSSLGTVVALLYRQGWKRRDELGLDREERLATRAEIAYWMWVPVTGALSIAVAFMLPRNGPEWLAGAPGLAYTTMGFTDVVMNRARRRWEARVEAEISGQS